ncbi:unnamed protein product [Cochlearia groenlandica]
MEQPSLRRSHSSPSLHRGGKSSCCGGTTGDCAALICCAPCSLVSLFVLSFYKVPRGVCRRVRRRRQAKKGKLENGGDSEKKNKKTSKAGSFAVHPKREEDEAVAKLDEEMWKKFNGGGFGRSNS